MAYRKKKPVSVRDGIKSILVDLAWKVVMALLIGLVGWYVARPMLQGLLKKAEAQSIRSSSPTPAKP